MPDETIPLPGLPIAPATGPIPAAAEATPPASAEPGEPKKRHRRTKAELEAARKAIAPPTPPPAATTAEDLERCRLGFRMIFGLVSTALTKKWGEEMTLKEEEVNTLASAWTDAVAPYLPKMGAQMPLATAAIATLLIALPRWDVYQAKKAVEELTK